MLSISSRWKRRAADLPVPTPCFLDSWGKVAVIEQVHILHTGAAALAYVLCFLAGRRLRPLRSLGCDHRCAMSFGAGVSIAYVFVQLMPEIHASRTMFAAAMGPALPRGGDAVYLVSLAGFVGYYGLDRFRAVEQETGGAAARSHRMHVGGFALYVALMAYLLCEEEAGGIVLAMTVAATAVHFLAVDHFLREEHGALYDRRGRFMLAGATVAGWALGLVHGFPDHAVALFIAFISGAVTINSAIMELPNRNRGRYLPFLAGAAAYGLLLTLI